MARHGKRYRNLLQSYDPERLYSLREAAEIVKKLGSAKFDETVDLSVRLGVDVRRADQIVRGSLSLPKGTGRSVKVAVFAAGEAATQAREAGADVVGADDLVKRVSEEGFLDFDVAISTPDMMAQVGRLGKILGPRGLMPNPKTGTVTNDVAKAVEEFKSGRVEYRTDRTGNIHLPIGKCSFPVADLLENARAAIDELVRVKPAAAKGRYLRSISLSTTMSPGVSVDPNKLRADEEELAQAS